MGMQQIRVRARKLIDPLNSHEFVEVEITEESDLQTDSRDRRQTTHLEEPYDVITRAVQECEEAVTKARRALGKGV